MKPKKTGKPGRPDVKTPSDSVNRQPKNKPWRKEPGMTADGFERIYEEHNGKTARLPF